MHELEEPKTAARRFQNLPILHIGIYDECMDSGEKGIEVE
jgi:hypothetical protein